MNRRTTVAHAGSLSPDDLAELVPAPNTGPQYCELCGELVPPDERHAPRAEALHCRACARGIGVELRSYVSPFSRSRADH